MKSPISLRRYLLMRFGITALLPVVMIAFLVWQFLIPQMHTDLAIQNRVLSRAIAGQISASLLSGERQLVAVANYIKDLEPRLPPHLNTLLDAQCGNGELFESIYIATGPDPTINSLGLSRPLRSRRSGLVGTALFDRSFFNAVRSSGKPAWSKTFRSKGSNRLAVALAIPLPDCLVVGEITLDRLSTVIRQLPLQADLYILVLDRQGRVIADSHGHRPNRQLNLSTLPPAISSGDAQHPTSAFTLDGHSLLATVIDVRQLDWKVLVAQPDRSALNPLRTALILIGCGLAIALLVALAAAWRQAGALSRIFRTYDGQVQAIARGEYDIDWPAARTVEFAHLVKNLQRMVKMISERENALAASETQLRITLDSIRENEKRLKDITANVPGVVYQFASTRDHMYTLAFVGAKAADLFGLKADLQTFADEFYAHIPDDEKERYLASIQDAVDNISPWHYEGRFNKPDGEVIWFSGDAVPHQEGDRIVFHGVLIDITRRRRMQESLRLTQFCVDKASIGIFRIGDQAQILDVNEKGCSSLGYSREELRTMTVYDIDPIFSREKWPEHIANLRKIKTRTIESLHRHKNGNIFPVQVMMNLMMFEDREFNVAFVQDISERKQAENEAKRLGAALLQSQKMEAIGTLAGGIAHDFNNILSAVIGYAELSLPEVSPETSIHSHLQKILTAGLRARDLVQQILTFSRKGDRQLHPLHPAPLVKEALKLLRSSLPATIEIAQQITPDTDPVLADPTQIHQIVMNLCTNAAHAMEAEGGLLQVRLSQVRLSERELQLYPELSSGAYIKLSVQDSGRGISPEIMQRIYDPYFTTKEKGKGTGLGLSVVHGIVQSYGGAINACSEIESGTTFNVYIPTIEHRPMLERHTEPELPGGDEHILLVDDEPLLVDVERQILEKMGYQVSTALDSTAALDIFRQRPDAFDLVLTDMTMPKMAGDRLARKLLDIRPDLPIILASGYSALMTAENALAMGIKAFVHKPIVEADLAGIVRKVLDAAIAEAG